MNSENSTFQTASVSKIFTSTAVLQLKDKGKLKHSDALVKYFSDFPYPNITVKHFLSHTSGLSDLKFYQSIIDKNPNLVIAGKDVIPALKLWNNHFSLRVFIQRKNRKYVRKGDINIVFFFRSSLQRIKTFDVISQ